MNLVKVSAHSVPKSVAGAIAGIIREGNKVEIQAVGAGAANQALKSVAIARVYLKDDQIEIVCLPAFTEIEIESEKRTAIQIIVEKR